MTIKEIDIPDELIFELDREGYSVTEAVVKALEYYLHAKSAEIPMDSDRKKLDKGKQEGAEKLSKLPDKQSDILAMENMNIDELFQVVHSQVSAFDQDQHLQLLEKNQLDLISSEEKLKLQELRLAADQLMLRKAYALATLKKRGYLISNLDDLTED